MVLGVAGGRTRRCRGGARSHPWRLLLQLHGRLAHGFARRGGIQPCGGQVIYDSLGARGATEIGRLLDRGTRVGVDVVPEWSLQARSRLDSLPTRRRYEWGSGVVELNVGCPIDSLF